MALLDLWKSKPGEYGKKHIQQLVAIAGDGALRDSSETSKELRELFGAVNSPQLGTYLNECLEGSFTDSGLVLQDIVNELGARLDCKVTHGLYRGKPGQIGFDGIWKFPDGYGLVIEIKTTDAYAINLDTVAGYRNQLIKTGQITEKSAILIVVGRKETGGLEAQVRGSRHAWDIRLISADKLFQLVSIKESAENNVAIDKIRSVLRPFELTRVDFVVDLLATTTADIEESTAEPEEAQAHTAAPSGKKFTPVAFNDEVAKRAGDAIGASVKRVTRSMYVSSDQKLSVRAVASRTHQYGDVQWFWYAFHPNYKDALTEHEKSYIAFGCGSPDRILLFPLATFVEWLVDLNTTQDEERMYWHVHFSVHPDGAIRLALKGKKKPVDVAQYLIKEKQ